MIRGLVMAAFLRWGILGALAAVLCIGVVGWWLLSAVWSWIEGSVYVLGVVAGLIYLLLLIALIGKLRSRRRSEHLLGYGRRRRWLDD